LAALFDIKRKYTATRKGMGGGCGGVVVALRVGCGGGGRLFTCGSHVR